MNNIEPNGNHCLIINVEFDKNKLCSGKGLLHKIGPTAFKDKRRFPNKDDVLHEGMLIYFDARNEFQWIRRGTIINENGVKGDGTIIISDTLIKKYIDLEEKK